MKKMILLFIVASFVAILIAWHGCPSRFTTNTVYIDAELAQLDLQNSLLFETTDNRLGVLRLLELGGLPMYSLWIDNDPKQQIQLVTNKVSKDNLILSPYVKGNVLFLFIPRGTVVFNPHFINRVAIVSQGHNEGFHAVTNGVVWIKVVHNAM